MKFLHTADIHYGAAPDANRPWGKERAQAVEKSFARIIRMCRKENIDMLLIAGGLFDGFPDEEEIRAVNEAFASIPETEVYIVEGTDDGGFEWAPNVKYSADDSVEIPGYRILLECDEKAESGKRFSPYCYVALGGVHKPHVYEGGRIVNAGSPEPLGPSETGKHGFYIGEIKNDELSALKFVSAGGVRYITLVANVTPASTCEEVKRALRTEMESRGRKNIYTVKLCGSCGSGVTFDLKELRDEFRIGEILNQTEDRYDYVRIFREHPSDMIGFFIKEMNVEDKSEIRKKALDYGVDALLKTADERL